MMEKLTSGIITNRGKAHKRIVIHMHNKRVRPKFTLMLSWFTTALSVRGLVAGPAWPPCEPQLVRICGTWQPYGGWLFVELDLFVVKFL